MYHHVHYYIPFYEYYILHFTYVFPDLHVCLLIKIIHSDGKKLKYYRK